VSGKSVEQLTRRLAERIRAKLLQAGKLQRPIALLCAAQKLVALASRRRQLGAAHPATVPPHRKFESVAWPSRQFAGPRCAAFASAPASG